MSLGAGSAARERGATPKDADDEREHDELAAAPTGTPISARCAASAPVAPSADDVREPEPAGELVARARDAQQRQQRDADDEVERVRDEQSGERARQRRTRAAK